MVKDILDRYGVEYVFQYPIDRYIADFYLPKYDVLVEVLSKAYVTRPSLRDHMRIKLRCYRKHKKHCILLVGSGPSMLTWDLQLQAILRLRKPKSSP